MTITAKVIADSVSLDDIRIITFEITYPRIIHSELMTHRVFSRNAASSRAIPIEKMIKNIRDNPAYPSRWGLNGKGMQDHGEMSIFGQKRVALLWKKGMDLMTSLAEEMIALPEVPHKQIANRVMEPWSHMTTVVTSTDWENFFALRDHAMADPTFGDLAAVMHKAYITSIPTELEPGTWHLPYVDQNDFKPIYAYALNLMPEGDLDLAKLEAAFDETALKVSTARCARVSYLNQGGNRSTIEEDVARYDSLVTDKPAHASPAEHQATPDVLINDTGLWLRPQCHGNFHGWIQHRKLIAGEAVPQRRYTGPRHKAA